MSWMPINLFQLTHKQTLALGMAVIQSAPYQILAALGHSNCNRILYACSFQSLGLVMHREKQDITKASSLMDPKRKESCKISPLDENVEKSCSLQGWIFLMLQTSIKLLSNVFFIVLQLSYDFCNTMQGEQRKTQPHTLFSGTHLTYFPTVDLPCSRYFLSALKSSKWSKHSQSLIKIEVKCFQQNPLCYHILTTWLLELQTCSERCLNNEVSFENAVAAVHISLQSHDCELYLSMSL